MTVKVCPKCLLPNTTLMWWENRKLGWVCLACGMGRREEQTRMEQKWLKDNRPEEYEKTKSTKKTKKSR